jgi:hypothetical protein
MASSSMKHTKDVINQYFKFELCLSRKLGYNLLVSELSESYYTHNCIGLIS